MYVQKGMYHQHFGDGADTEHIHGDSHLHGRACNRKYPYTVVFFNENQIKFVPPGPARRLPRSIRARTSGSGGTGHTTSTSPIYHLDLGQRADAQHVHCDSHLHGRACKRTTILTPTRLPRPPRARESGSGRAVKALGFLIS